MEYFKPITDWLTIQNENETIGWPEISWVPPIPEGYPGDIGKQKFSCFLLNTNCELNVLLFVPLDDCILFIIFFLISSFLLILFLHPVYIVFSFQA